MVLGLEKRILSLFLALCALLPAAPAASAAAARAESAIVYEPRTGTVLDEKDAAARRPVARPTTIMTALVVLERCALTERVTVTAAEAATEGSSMYLEPGAAYSVEELLYGLLLVSGNDAAAALADHCAGDMASFAARMNEKAAALGLRNSHFVNAHGLDAADHYSSARDLALLTAAAMENETFCRIFGERSYDCRGVTLYNHNKLLTSCEGCLGGKTGYTSSAGRVLVSCAEREGLRLICVTISDPDDWADHAALYDETFAAWRYLPLPGSAWASLPLLSGTRSRVRLVCDVPGFLVPRGADVRLTVRLPRFVFAPTIYGLPLGSVELRTDGALRAVRAVSAAESVPLDGSVPMTARERFKRAWFLAMSRQWMMSPLAQRTIGGEKCRNACKN